MLTNEELDGIKWQDCPIAGWDVFGGERNKRILLKQIIAQAKEANKLREQLATAEADALETFAEISAWNKVLIDAMKKLSFAAQITGGTAGPDKNLIDAIQNAGNAMSMSGFVKAIRALKEKA